MLPEKIGRYEIREELGRGGMATVYRAYDSVFERDVALKILPQELLHNPQFRERFEREAKIIARLEHAAIVPVHDVGQVGDLPFFVMRFMSGGSLTDRMRAAPLSLEETVRIIQRVAAGLDFAHSKGIIHRDVKPDNILFDENGDAYISDFGIAKLVRSETNLTGTGILGTPAYISPEQAQGEEVDGRSDIYSLGAIVYQMLSGEPPYVANTPLAMVFKHVQEPIPHILDVNPNLPTTIEDVLEKALAKDRNERFSSATSLANALAVVARGEKPDLDYTRPIPTHPHMPAVQKNDAGQAASKPIRWQVGIFGLVAALAIFAAALAGSRFSGRPAATPTLAPVATNTAPAPTAPPPTATFTATATGLPTLTPTATLIPGIGGADKIALLANSNVYLIDLFGGDPFQLTTDGKEKLSLQWLPGGKELSYIQGQCLNRINVETQQKSIITCIESPYFDSFSTSPDGKQAAITIERHLVVIPFNLETLAGVKTRYDLENQKDVCLIYTKVAAKGTQWSTDGKKLAVLFQSAKNGTMSDYIRVMDVSRCKDADPLVRDEFPNRRFVLDGYAANPFLPAYSWDGQQRFIFNTFKRNEGYGDLYLYDMASGQVSQINPIDGTCCYRDARFSPDGNYILFAFQDLRQGENSETQLYYIPVEALGKGEKFSPLPISALFFTNPREKIRPALRPASP